MNLQFYFERLHASDAFKEFIKENPKEYLCSGFFTIDKESRTPEGTDEKHFDFYIPDKKEMFILKIVPEGVERLPVEMAAPGVPEKISNAIDFDFKEVEKLILDEMEKQKVKNKLQKIMISLQKFEGKEALICTVFVSMLGLLKVYIDPKTKKVIHFEKKSLFDIVKRVK